MSCLLLPRNMVSSYCNTFCYIEAFYALSTKNARIRCYCSFCFLGERLDDPDIDAIVKFTELQEDLDGNVKYEGKSQLL